VKLDENQQKAVEHFEGPALVVAGPGSGKTTVIKERILHLIRNHNVNPEKILAIVFNNAAADEIEKRILGELNSNHGYPEIRTLHGFGKDIITGNYKRAGFSECPENWTTEIDEIIAEERRQIEREASDASDGFGGGDSEIVSTGEEVEVKVIEFDQENGKVSLSLKQMTSDPWENVEVKYPIGSKVSGVVVNVVDYGAFIQLEEGIVGLIHVSEMPLVLNNMSRLDLLNENDELEVTVLKISRDSQRISLSIK